MKGTSQSEGSRAYDTTKENGVHMGMATMWQVLFIKWSDFCMHNITAKAERFSHVRSVICYGKIDTLLCRMISTNNP